MRIELLTWKIKKETETKFEKLVFPIQVKWDGEIWNKQNLPGSEGLISLPPTHSLNTSYYFHEITSSSIENLKSQKCSISNYKYLIDFQKIN